MLAVMADAPALSRSASLRGAPATAAAGEAEGERDMLAGTADAPALIQSAALPAGSGEETRGHAADVLPETTDWRALPLPVHERQSLYVCQLTDLRAWHSAAASAAAATQDRFAADDGPTCDDLRVRNCAVFHACYLFATLQFNTRTSPTVQCETQNSLFQISLLLTQRLFLTAPLWICIGCVLV